jgi:hypothetical protein
MPGELSLKQGRKKIEKWRLHGTFEVSGWRYEGDFLWHLKVWPENRDVWRNIYKVMSGAFEPDTATDAEREAVLHLIAQWEHEHPKAHPSRIRSLPTDQLDRLA